MNGGGSYVVCEYALISSLFHSFYNTVLIPQIKPVEAAFPGLLITNYLFFIIDYYIH
jgi:hypothetical protein